MNRARSGGAVLLFVLVLVALLAALAVQTVRTAEIEVFTAYAGVYARQAEAMAESGLLAAGTLLLEDSRQQLSDNLTEDWAAFPELSAYPGRWFLDGHVSGRIEDETGKFPINSLHPGLRDHTVFEGIFLRLLQAKPFALSSDKAQALLAALVDWLDADDAPRSGGAEDATYAAARLPYRVKNTSLDTLGELLLVKGFSRDLLYGHDATPGLLSVLTVWGPGLININTAPLPVLTALPTNLDATRTASVAKAADAYRRDPVRRDELAGTSWLQKAVTEQDVAWPSQVLTTRSQYFSVTIEGRSGAATRRLYAVLKRGRERGSGDSRCDILYRQLR